MDNNSPRCRCSRKARISSGVSGLANHCMLFFTNIWIAVHLIERPRSIAVCTPPPIDMCAPRRSLSFVMSTVAAVSDRRILISALEKRRYRLCDFRQIGREHLAPVIPIVAAPFSVIEPMLHAFGIQNFRQSIRFVPGVVPFAGAEN